MQVVPYGGQQTNIASTEATGMWKGIIWRYYNLIANADSR